MTSNRREVNDDAIDFTRLAISTAPCEAAPFSFVVIGDTDAGAQSPKGKLADSPISFSEQLAEQMLQKIGDGEAHSDLLLHTGDITYPVGSYQNYLEGFLRPYRRLLSKVPATPKYSSSDVVFNRPLLPVPGNHDYASPRRHRFLRKVWQRLCDYLRKAGLDLGHYGGEDGEAYETTFLDSRKHLSDSQLKQHLVNHYSAPIRDYYTDKETVQYCLNYSPGQFTRLPNRYYHFRYGDVDFFALDSNTWNIPADAEGFDRAQLDWLVHTLTQSWQRELSDRSAHKTTARIIYLHHSPYTTEESRWQQSQTLWVRRHLRAAFDRVAQSLGHSLDDYSSHHRLPLVDLVLGGHAHCFEHIKTGDTGHADSHIDWVVCGGSGAGIRRQRQTGSDILESLSVGGRRCTSVVAKSRLYVGSHGSSRKRKQFHSFVQVKIRPSQKNKIAVCPFVVSQHSNSWKTEALKPIEIASREACLNIIPKLERTAS